MTPNQKHSDREVHLPVVNACRGCLSPLALFCPPSLSMLPDVRRPVTALAAILAVVLSGRVSLVVISSRRGSSLQGQPCRGAVRRSPLLCSDLISEGCRVRAEPGMHAFSKSWSELA
jgi:hypothetical protein